MSATALTAKPALETRFVGPEGSKVIHRVKTWSTGSGYRNGVSELNPSRGILRKSESPRIRPMSHPRSGALALIPCLGAGRSCLERGAVPGVWGGSRHSVLGLRG